MNVNPGALNKRISFISKTRTIDEEGYYIDTETIVLSCSAKFTRTSGTELIKADADFSDVKCRFLIRHTNTPLDRKMLVRYAGDDYGIVYLNDYADSHEYIEIWCKRATKEGA